MTCIITGCAVHNRTTGQAAWCDLHTVPGYFICNIATHDGKTPIWTVDAKVNDAQRVLSYDWPGDALAFEKGPVLVLPKSWCELNQTALDYIGGRVEL